MSRTQYLVAAIALPLLVAGCSDDASPPSAPRAEPSARVATSALATERFRTRLREVAADASFLSIDATGCVETAVDVFGAAQTWNLGPGKPLPQPVALVFVFQDNFCTGELLRSLVGLTNDGTFQADRKKLTEASLQATIPATDLNTNAEVQVAVDVTGAGTGELAFSSQNNRLRQPGLLSRFWFKGTARQATASGKVSIAGETLTPDAANFAEIFRATEGELDVVRTR